MIGEMPLNLAINGINLSVNGINLAINGINLSVNGVESGIERFTLLREPFAHILAKQIQHIHMRYPVVVVALLICRHAVPRSPISYFPGA